MTDENPAVEERPDRCPAISPDTGERCCERIDRHHSRGQHSHKAPPLANGIVLRHYWKDPS